MSSTEVYQTIWEHFDSLRNVLLKSLAVFLTFSALAFLFSNPIIDFLKAPLQQDLIHYEVKTERIHNPKSTPVIYKEHRILPGESIEIKKTFPQRNLFIFNPLEGFILSVKCSLWVGFIFSSPFWMIFLISFFMPGLHPFEKSLVLPFVLLTFLFMGLGAFAAYKVSIPLANDYLYSFNEKMGENLWSLSQYLSYTMTLLLAHAISFELALALLFLVHFQVISASSLIHYRRQVIVGAFILGALLTPPDVVTQILLSSFLIGIYELAILYGKSDKWGYNRFFRDFLPGE